MFQGPPSPSWCREAQVSWTAVRCSFSALVLMYTQLCIFICLQRELCRGCLRYSIFLRSSWMFFRPVLILPDLRHRNLLHENLFRQRLESWFKCTFETIALFWTSKHRLYELCFDYCPHGTLVGADLGLIFRKSRMNIFNFNHYLPFRFYT